MDAQTYPHGVLEPLEEVEKSSHKMEKPAENRESPIEMRASLPIPERGTGG